MKRVITIGLILSVIIVMLTGCISYNIKLPDIADVSIENSAETTAAIIAETTAPQQADTTQENTMADTQPNPESPDRTVAAAENNITVAPDTQRSPSSLSAAEILSEMAMAINGMKNYQGGFTASQNKKITLNITDCSLPGMTSVVNSLVQKLAGEDKNFTYNFNNGTAEDGDGNFVTATEIVPPRGKIFALTSEGIVSAKAEQSGENTVYTVVLVAETADFEHMCPTHHGAGLGFLNLASVDISPAKITKADMQYSGGTVVVTVDGQGRLVQLRDYLPMAGTGGGSLGVLSADATFNGSLDETWTFTW